MIGISLRQACSLVLCTQYLVPWLSRGVLIGILALGGHLSAEDVPTAFLLTESPFAAHLANIDPEWNFSFSAAGKVRVIAAADLAVWGRCRDVESGPQIVLTDGGLIRADLLRMSGTEIVLGDATGLGHLQWEESRLPKTTIKAVMLQPPSSTTHRDKLLHELTTSHEAEDRLFLIGGESIVGTITALPKSGPDAPQDGAPREESIQLLRRGSTEPLTIPASKVMALSFASRARSAASLQTTSVWLGFADGSLLQATNLAVKADTVTITLAAGGQLKTTLAGRSDPAKKFWDSLRYVEPVNPRVTLLSDLKPLGYKHIPFLSVERPFGADTSVLNSRLRAGGALFRKGLGMPAAARLAYDVSGYRRFEAELALDDQAGLRGSVIFKVLLESAPNQWQPAYESPVLRGGDPPLPISVDLKGASRIALLTDFADRGDECDYADWLNARLIK